MAKPFLCMSLRHGREVPELLATDALANLVDDVV